MKILFVAHDDIDYKRWDDTVEEAYNGMIYAYSWYLDIVCQHQWDALMLEDYSAVMPLPGKQKAGICYMFQPFFTQQLGVFSTHLLTAELVQHFIQAVPAKFKLIAYNLNSFNKVDALPDKFIMQRLNHELDLIKAYDDLKKGYSQNMRRNIRKGERNNIKVMKNIRPEEVIALFREFKGKDIHALKEGQYRMLKQLVYQCWYKGKALTYGAYDERNTLQAGAIFLLSHRRAIFLFSGTSNDARNTGAMPLLIDTFIREHAQQHLTLDFEGSVDVNLARFYSGFGAQRVFYHQYKKQSLLWPLRVAFSLWRMIR